MASQTTSSLLFLLLLVTSPFLSCESRPSSPVFGRPRHRACYYDAIYQFGDSISDTGNLIREAPNSIFRTLLNKATGRMSNAQTLNLPLLEPYLKGKDGYPHGVNFAVGGSTALPTEVLLEHGVLASVTNSSLSVQLQWFLDHVHDVVHSKDGPSQEELFQAALFMIGEVGANDYGFAFLEGKSMSEVRDLVPAVVNSIIHVVKELIARGAKRLVVPGNFLFGCFPIYLTIFITDDPNAYDDRFCLKDFNNFAKYHNNQLKAALEEVQRNNPEIIIKYGDYYSAYESLMKSVTKQGYGDNMLQACCGAGGAYNFNITGLCGTPAASACKHPERYISWDGIHGTQMAYEYMANWLVKDMKLRKQCV